ncbi:alpha/beta fold hydrolase [Nanoarchaeota archaeon]
MEYNYTTIKGLKTSYLKVGSGEPIILLHGLFSHCLEYERLINLLKKNFTVYGLNLPGFGDTVQPKRVFSIDDFADFVLKFMNKMGIKRTSIIAHSGGGIVATDFSIKYPKRVKKLILVSAAGIKLNCSKRKIFYRLFVVQPIVELFNFREWRRLFALMGMNIFDFIVHPFRGNLWKSILKDMEVDYESSVRNLKVPTVLLWGDKDEIFPLDYARRFHKLIPKSKFIVVPGHHLWILLGPEKYWKRIKPKII